jgi:hypothetical protein
MLLFVSEKCQDIALIVYQMKICNHYMYHFIKIKNGVLI